MKLHCVYAPDLFINRYPVDGLLHWFHILATVNHNPSPSESRDGVNFRLRVLETLTHSKQEACVPSDYAVDSGRTANQFA